MFCKNCGNPVNGTPFCTACGTKVDTAAPVDDLEATVMADDTAAAMAAAEAAQAAPVQPAYQQPVQPAYQQPVQPAYEQPDQPAYEQPVQPAYEQPVQPVYQQPVQPAYQQPVQPAYQQPVQPAYEQPSYQQPEYMPPEPPKKKNTGLIIGIAVASIVAVVGIVVAILFGTGVIGDSKKDKDDDDDEPKTTASTQVDATNGNNNDDPIEIPSNAQSEAFTIGGNVPITQAIPTNPMPTQPSGSQSTANFIIGNNYTYIPAGIDEYGYDKFIAATTISDETMYIEVDYNNGDFEDEGGIIYVAYDTVAINIVVDSYGYYEVYLVDLEDGYQVYNATDEYEPEDVEIFIVYAYLMGFDLDEGFYNMLDHMPPHYTYEGTTTHSYLGTVDVFTFTCDGGSYEVWIDTETGVTARLYENGNLLIETSAAYADNSLEITDLS